MDQFLGEIRLFPWNWAPVGWHLCDGTIFPISQYTALFALLGTQYGGNGQTTFALPDLRGRVPIHMGPVYQQGETDGQEQVTLTISNMPAHPHTLLGTSQPGTSAPIPASNAVLSKIGNATDFHYAPDTTAVSLIPASVQSLGGGQPHDNMQPYLVLNFCIAMTGYFPSRN